MGLETRNGGAMAMNGDGPMGDSPFLGEQEEMLQDKQQFQVSVWEEFLKQYLNQDRI